MASRETRRAFWRTVARRGGEFLKQGRRAPNVKRKTLDAVAAPCIGFRVTISSMSTRDTQSLPCLVPLSGWAAFLGAWRMELGA